MAFMRNTRLIFFVLILLSHISGYGQTPRIDSIKTVLEQSPDDSNKVKTYVELSKAYRTIAGDQVLVNSKAALALAEKIDYPKGKALGFKWIGLYYFDKSDYLNAADYFQRAYDEFQKLHDQDGIANIANNLGSVSYNTGNYAKALQYYTQALELALKSGDVERIATAKMNIGLSYMEKPATHKDAIAYLKDALAMAITDSNQYIISLCNVNLGEVYMFQKNDALALHHFEMAKKAAESDNSTTLPYILNKMGDVMVLTKDYTAAKQWYEDAYAKAEKNGNKLDMVNSANGLAAVYKHQQQYDIALDYLQKASTMAAEINVKKELKNSYKGLAEMYNQKSDYRNAYQYQLKYSNIADELNLNQSDSIQRRFEVGLKEKEIKLNEEEIRRQKLVRNALILGFVLVSALIFILYRDYRTKIKTNKLLDQRKAEIESLLLNILPYEVAVELQNTGQATPRFYDNASVLFTDFVSFSKIAETLSPQQVVEELNEFFIAMDNIIEKYQLEKIKTIGDSYMCAGGVPTVNQTHPIAIVKAGIEILEYLHHKNVHRENTGLPKWELRIGIHSGPLVAGVVGKKKYAYDIWGSTVNIASRMESNGQPGLLNISAALYEQIKDRFECTYRGKIYAKNVGEIDMYFVNREITTDNTPQIETIILKPDTQITVPQDIL
jgi:class 3 adenylate cyclase